MDTKVDAWGQVTIDIEAVAEALYNGLKPQDLTVNPSPAVDRLNEKLAARDLSHLRLSTAISMENTPEQEHARRRASWLLGGELGDLDVRSFLRSMCETEDQRARIDEEMDLFEERDLVPLLRTMICLVDHFRQRKVLWGVGRGSSVASYVLYRIGINRIDPMRYGLSIHEFLK